MTEAHLPFNISMQFKTPADAWLDEAAGVVGPVGQTGTWCQLRTACQS